MQCLGSTTAAPVRPSHLRLIIWVLPQSTGARLAAPTLCISSKTTVTADWWWQEWAAGHSPVSSPSLQQVAAAAVHLEISRFGSTGHAVRLAPPRELSGHGS